MGNTLRETERILDRGASSGSQIADGVVNKAVRHSHLGRGNKLSQHSERLHQPHDCADTSGRADGCVYS